MNKSISLYIKNGLFILFSFLIITYIFLEVFMPEKTTDVLGFKSYIIVTSSMEPDIMVNDVIIIHKVKEENLSVGDAITFNVYIPELGAKSEVTHYIGEIIRSDTEVAIYKTQGATKPVGDYDNWKDEHNEVVDITYEDIEGEVILVVPYLGHVVNILRDPISLVLLVTNVVIIYLLVRVIKKPKEENETIE